MPIPHEVTKEFFVPSDDLPFIGDDAGTNGNGPIEQRINDLIFLFNLLDQAFGRRNNQNETPQTPTEEPTEEPAENTQTENQEEATEEDKVTEVPAPEEENAEQATEEAEQTTENAEETTENSSSNEQQTENNSGLPNLNELDLLTLELLLMRQRMRNQRHRNARQRQMFENDN